MTDTVCPKCRTRSTDSQTCSSCGLVFAEYDREKQESIGRVFQLISSGRLTEAKAIAETLAGKFPDSQSDFLILLSNINRDISIVEKYSQARALFAEGDFSQAALLLRNIKAFDKILDEKVISLRKKALRFGDHDNIFNEAVEKFNAGRFGRAKSLLETIDGYKQQVLVNEYLQKINDIKTDLFRLAVDCLHKNLFESAGDNFAKLHGQFPEMEALTGGYIDIIAKKNDIKKNLLAAAEQAKEEQRFIEAKVLYSFLGWQYPEFRPRLAPYLDEISSRAVTSLADFSGSDAIDFSALGLTITRDGFLEPAGGPNEAPVTNQLDSQSAPMGFVAASPDPAPDIPDQPLDLDCHQTADFTY
jgi:hypothetical protein